MLLRPLGAMKGCWGTAGADTGRGVAGAPTKAGTGAAKGSFGMGVAPAAPASASTPTRAEAVRGMQDIVQASAPFLQSLGSVRSCEGIEEACGPCYSARRVPSDPAVGRGAAGLARPARLAA